MKLILAAGTESGAGFALALAVVVALVYLLVLRLLDLNEKEPLWALSMSLVFGGVAAALVPVFTDATWLLNALGDGFFESLAKVVALLGALAIFNGIANLRGWSEINGLMDGVVYGATVGLGFAVGDAFVHQLTVSGSAAASVGSPLTVLWSTLLAGLRQGLFGALIGAGFGAAVQAKSAGQRFLYPVAGFVVAVIVHALYFWLAHGGAAGSQGGLRTLIAMVLPLVLVVVLMVTSLGREKKAIREELQSEVSSGFVTEGDLALLENPGQRRSRYLKYLSKGDFDEWQALRMRQNRQVQLALAKRRAASETDPERRARAEREIAALRASLGNLATTGAPAAGGKVGA
ncbi:MAG TPA: PrsW family glutamic-type intramembrane protease [Actinomycetota bacterium]|nr:PrsW family glutamic-type intramembrane protease [Actinomycetota bacterium]